MKIITYGKKLPRATSFSGDEEVQEYIEQALADAMVWFEVQDSTGDFAEFFIGCVDDPSGVTCHIWHHPDRDSIVWSELPPAEIVKKMNDLVDEAEAEVAKWKSKRGG